MIFKVLSNFCFCAQKYCSKRNAVDASHGRNGTFDVSQNLLFVKCILNTYLHAVHKEQCLSVLSDLILDLFFQILKIRIKKSEKKTVESNQIVSKNMFLIYSFKFIQAIEC